MKKKLIIGIVLLGGSGIAHAQMWKSSVQFRQAFLNRINIVRQQGCNCGGTYMPPAPPLVWNDNLEVSASRHARDMDRLHYFSHTSQDGRTMGDRIGAAGYKFEGLKAYTIGENIAFGQESIEEVNDGWFKSPGHCKNLMNAAFKEIGISEYNTYWVEDFGGRIGFSPSEQQMIRSGAKIVVKHASENH
ncbi:CAP domain-containing protein [Mucilaginibacter robiniae]|uniref:CAP domain-containing protein n=1 Tax=Mucilaginibacter robiniae TaxID=2728022 RepID=A0A7L5E3W0_9SPHI|nr:CAP domain-containing protein [Mucilaginibacter robiniae]QJD97775.1 CAP domain-containing protein [Mucilaginibacter robiniae]